MNFIAVEADITDQIEAREHLRRAREAAEEVAEQKVQFLATMSHEIRMPLNAVIGLTDLLLLLDSELDEQQQGFVRTANESGALLLNTINNILTFSAAKAGTVELDFRDFELGAVVGQTLSLFLAAADEKSLAIDVEVGERVPVVVRVDVTRPQQVLVNLVGNAVKFTESGSVAVAVTSEASTSTGHRVRIGVSDTGIGIAPDRLDRLFEPFVQADATTTRRYGGSGLGLAIAQRIASLMGGEISVHSTVGVGTRFEFTVELATAEELVASPTVVDAA